MMFSLPVLLLAVSFVSAAPMETELDKRAGVTAVSAATIASYKRYTMFARAAYCPPSTTATWTCGANCDALPGFVTYGSGGDGAVTQYWYVGYDQTLGIVVGHQGTNTSKLIADLTDVNLLLAPLNPTLFPGVPLLVLAHSGFQGTHARSAPGVLAAVQNAMAATGSTKVNIVGHSLGAAIALLDSLYLPLHLPATTTFTTRMYGLPRVGNPAFANWVDLHVTDFVHINNKEDPVPTLPSNLPLGLGYEHPDFEKHILDSGAWVACSGHDNPDVQCTTGDVPTLFQGNTGDHDGPYDGISLGGCH